MLRHTLADFCQFLRAPQLCPPAPLCQGRGRWAIMLGTYLAGLVVIGVALALWQRAFHLPAPEAFGGYRLPALVAISVLAAPPGEEALFRGWLTGRPRALWLLALALVAVALLAAITVKWHEIAAVFGLLALVIAAPVGWYRLRRLDTPGWFARGFGVWFHLSAVVFGLMHLTNYPRQAHDLADDLGVIAGGLGFAVDVLDIVADALLFFFKAFDALDQKAQAVVGGIGHRCKLQVKSERAAP